MQGPPDVSGDCDGLAFNSTASFGCILSPASRGTTHLPEAVKVNRQELKKPNQNGNSGDAGCVGGGDCLHLAVTEPHPSCCLQS